MVKSAGLIALGISIGVVATLMLSRTPRLPRGTGPEVFAPSGGVPEAVAVRNSAGVADEAELLDIILDLEDLVTDLNARLQDSRRLVTYYEDRDSREREATRGLSPEQIVERLVDAGMTQDRAEWILDRDAELYRERVAATFSAESYANSWEGLLRQELGDADFDAYLRAKGEVPAVQVGAVGETSAAGLAGLRYGDHIRSYDGHRVFDVRELVPLTLRHGSDESVLIDVVRDGQRMQLIVPGGTLDAELSSGRMFTAPSFDPRQLLAN